MEKDLNFLKEEKNIYKNKYNWMGVHSIYVNLFIEYIDANYKNAYVSKHELTYFVNSEKLTVTKKTMSFFDTTTLSLKGVVKKVPDFLKKDIEKNKNKRFIIYFMNLRVGPSGHANCIIYDTKKNEVELFEPYGDVSDILKKHGLEKKMEKAYDNIKPIFKSLFDQKTTFCKPLDFLPKISFQALEEQTLDCAEKSPIPINTRVGFCVAWSFFYIEQRIKYPDIDKKVLVNSILKKIKNKNPDSKESICYLIRNYTGFLIKLFKDKKFIKKVFLFGKVYGKPVAKFVVKNMLMLMVNIMAEKAGVPPEIIIGSNLILGYIKSVRDLSQ